MLAAMTELVPRPVAASIDELLKDVFCHRPQRGFGLHEAKAHGRARKKISKVRASRRGNVVAQILLAAHRRGQR